MLARRALLLLSLAAGCSYAPRTLTPGGGDGDVDGGDTPLFTSCGPGGLECGAGEICAVVSGGARCECGPDTAGDGPVCEQGVEVCAVDGCNTPPVAAIVDPTPDALLHLAGNAQVRVDGTPSRDADGDALTFTWTVLAGDCVATELEDATGLMRFVSAAAGTTCSVQLVVTDPSGASDALTFDVQIVGVGGWVKSGDGCANNREGWATAIPPPGSRDAPWCSIADGLWAASNFGLANISVGDVNFAESEPLVVPPGVLVQGGWNFAPAAPQASTTRTPVSLTLEHGLRFAAGDGAGLRNFAFTGAGDCGECAFVVNEDATITVDNVGIHLTSGGDSAVAMLVRSTGPAASLRGTNVDVTASGAARTYGVVIDARRASVGTDSRLTLDAASTVTVSASQFAFALHTLRANAVVLNGASLSVDGAGQTAYGLAAVDGLMSGYVPNYTGAGCPGDDPAQCCADTFTCHGSASFLAQQASFWVSGVVEGYGLSLLGTRSAEIVGESAGNPTVANNTVTAVTASTRAVGVRLAESSNVRIRGAHVAAAATSNSPASPVSVIAIMDGSVSDDMDVGGSSNLALTDVTVNVDDPAMGAPERLFGVALIDTSDARLTDVAVTFEEEPRFPESATSIAGLHLRSTSGTYIERASVTMSGGGGAVIAPLIDGEMNTNGDFTSGSNNLTLTNSNLETTLGPTQMSGLRGCVILNGTDGAIITRNRLACRLATGLGSNDALFQVITRGTDDVQITRNELAMRGDPANGIVAPHSMVGVLDGSLQEGDTDDLDRRPASQDLEIVANHIQHLAGDQTPHRFVGIFLRRGRDGASARVVNNAIIDLDAHEGYGVIVDHFDATLLHNTVRLRCEIGANDCIDSVALGVYALHGGPGGVLRLVGNLLDLEATQRAGVLDGTGSDGQWTLSEMRYNSVTQGAPIYRSLDDNSADIFLVPFASATAKTCTQAGAGPSACDKNYQTVSFGDFCTDSYHLTASAPAVNAVTIDTGVHDDMDRDARPVGSFRDMGADEVHTTLPECARGAPVEIGPIVP